MRRQIPKTLGSAAIAILLTMPAAHAECYDILGCTNTAMFSKHFDYLASRGDGPTCDFLYLMRNLIYKEHGYCFRTPRGRSAIGNDGCHIDDIAAVPLNRFERANVATIARAERLKACPAS